MHRAEAGIRLCLMCLLPFCVVYIWSVSRENNLFRCLLVFDGCIRCPTPILFILIVFSVLSVMKISTILVICAYFAMADAGSRWWTQSAEAEERSAERLLPAVCDLLSDEVFGFKMCWVV